MEECWLKGRIWKGKFNYFEFHSGKVQIKVVTIIRFPFIKMGVISHPTFCYPLYQFPCLHYCKFCAIFSQTQHTAYISIKVLAIISFEFQNSGICSSTLIIYNLICTFQPLNKKTILAIDCKINDYNFDTSS